MKIFVALLTLVTFAAWGQEKKKLDHTVYSDWKSLSRQKISSKGNFITYEINPHRGDGYLYLYNTQTAVLDSFPRGEKAFISDDESYFSFIRTAGFDTLRTCELKKVDKKLWPKDTLVVIRLADMKMTEIPKLKSVDYSSKGGWMVYSIDSNYVEKKEEPKKKKGLFKKKKKKDEKPAPKVTSSGKLMYIFNPASDYSMSVKDVTDFSIGDSAKFLYYITQQKIDKDEHFKLIALNLRDKKETVLDTTSSKFPKISFSPNENIIAYLATADTSKAKNYSLYLYDLKDDKRYSTLDSNNMEIGSGRMPSEHQSLLFTKDGQYLYFGVAAMNEEEAEDSLLASEKPVLDIWHYQDKRLQPQQLLSKRRDLAASDLYALNMKTFVLSQLENDSIKTYANTNLKGKYLLGSNVLPYQQTYNWTVPNLEDHYLIHIETGEKQLIKKAVGMGGSLSPTGRWYTYFDEASQKQRYMDVASKEDFCMTCGADSINFQSDNNGMPFTPYPYGIYGYNRDETAAYITSEFDIWKYDFTTKKLVSATNTFGKKNQVELRFKEWSRDSVYVESQNIYLMGTDKRTKDEMIYSWTENNGSFDMKLLYRTPHAINVVEKADKSDQVLIRKSSLELYPEAFLTDLTFKNEKRISVTNPQQSDYNWAKVEIIDYTSRDGQKLQALLYRPEDFDSAKEYPMIVYYYELYTDRFHGHYSPRPTASIIYPTEYASAGYVVLIPDIRYKPGYPARGAYNCIMGATDAALALYPNIDSTRMGLQGQSWGGYQTAQLVTMTDRYAAAMAGAPVANMFSAYGGIRWGSGLNRQFQYEKTQSRIGKTIWEAPELYIENSPLFHLPKVETPLLIMHNDEDGAVPWYQGIELFTGMKRLGKPCWMLNYNGDDHNLMKDANRRDLSLRMRQFFDHYLLEQPAPRWLVDGLPATVKGKELRYELIEEEEN
ncbi:MAG: prolyl oligopeptidase family serine peptidase [Crocinitomicaceae bacterium]|jgi:dipeptidyl aminopeptidase/acylaminoacyl peptidase|nr:prolyl oligopeptidase family serine peptidase [Crocinitomicaceae bacterium]